MTNSSQRKPVQQIAFVLATVIVLPSAGATAATVSLSRSTRPVSVQEVADGAPVGGLIHEFFITSDTDLLCLGGASFGAPLFQHTLGSDVAPPSGEALAAAPALGADSFIAFPGSTQMIGGGFSPSPGDHTWFDVSNDGAQQNFLFARLTTAGTTSSFSGDLYVRGYDAPVVLPFDFTLPGTEAELALLDEEPTFALEYSLDPTAAPVPPPALPEPAPVPAPPEVPLVVTPPPSFDPPEAATPADVPPAPPETPTIPDFPSPDILLVDGDLDLCEVVPEVQIGYTPIVWSEYWTHAGSIELSLINLTTIDLTAFDRTLGLTDVTTFQADYMSRLTVNSNIGIVALGRADGAFAKSAESQIPEPSAALLAAVALLGLPAVRRR